MLFEDFLNRYISKKFNRLAFPSIIFPWMIILGLFMMVASPLVFLLDESDWSNRDKLFMACYMTGLGFFGGSIFTGCFWGLMKERLSQAYLRPNFRSAFSLYVVLMMFCWFHVWFFVGGFLYKYPTQGYRSYVLEVSPTPDLKAEIEQWGLYEIKRHTPYDYSLDKQTIRYDFLDASSDPTFESREDMFFRAASFYEKPHQEIWMALDGVVVNMRPTEYPSLVKGQAETKCAVRLVYSADVIQFKSKEEDSYLTLRKLASSDAGGWYDVTEAFVPIDDLGVCKLRRLDANRILARFIITKALLPQVHQNVFEAYRRGHRHTDFGMKHLRAALDSF